MKHYFLQAIAPYFFMFLFLCLDLWIFFAIGKPISFCVLSFFIAILFARPFSWGQTIWAFMLLMNSALTIGLPIWWPLLLGLPLCISILTIRNHIFGHPLYPALAVGLYLWLDLLILRPFLLQIPRETTYTIGIIFGTMILTILFSLKLKTGKIGQSLTLA